MKQAVIIESPLGCIGLAQQDGAITNLFFEGTVQPKGYQLERTPLLARAEEQLGEYFAGARRTFDLPLRPEGTEFQRRVWEELLKIPYGQTRSYLEIARAIGRPTACRAVGHANGCNPISILIPCHRVIGAGGGLTGYAGGLEMKRKLLEIEGLL